MVAAGACTLPQWAHCHAEATPLDSHAVRLAIPRETAPREQRVSLIPETVAKLVKAGFQASVEAGAGLAAGHTDEAYQKAGATIAADFRMCTAGAQAVFKVREPAAEEVAAIPEGALLLGLLGRGENAALMDLYRSRRIGVFSLNALPRISRAQKMDALSSMAACAGYKSVLLAAATSGKFFPLLMTAAGTVAPSRVFVLGAGLAGRRAMARVGRLGGVGGGVDGSPAGAGAGQRGGGTCGGRGIGEASAGRSGPARHVAESSHQLLRRSTGSRPPNTDAGTR